MPTMSRTKSSQAAYWYAASTLKRMIEHARKGYDIYVISGEGENGTHEVYDGPLTVTHMRARILKECAGGDRWCRIDTLDGQVLMGCD